MSAGAKTSRSSQFLVHWTQYSGDPPQAVTRRFAGPSRSPCDDHESCCPSAKKVLPTRRVGDPSSSPNHALPTDPTRAGSTATTDEPLSAETNRPRVHGL